MPLLAKHAGAWEGVYMEVDPDGNVIDRHRSHLIDSFPESRPDPCYQINLTEAMRMVSRQMPTPRG